MTFDPDLIRRTPEQMGQADRAAATHGHSGPALMAAAGRAVARSISRYCGKQYGGPCRVLILAGPGNNGGDGYIAAKLLRQQGWPVRVAALAPPRTGSDAADAALQWHGPMAPFDPVQAARADLVVDAVFGAGLTRCKRLDGLSPWSSLPDLMAPPAWCVAKPGQRT